MGCFSLENFPYTTSLNKTFFGPRFFSSLGFLLLLLTKCIKTHFQRGNFLWKQNNCKQKGRWEKRAAEEHQQFYPLCLWRRMRSFFSSTRLSLNANEFPACTLRSCLRLNLPCTKFLAPLMTFPKRILSLYTSTMDVKRPLML